MDLDEEVRERPLTEKLKAKFKAKAARESRPATSDEARQLAIKFLDEYDRVYTDDDLNEDVHLSRALRLIHAKKIGIPFDEVPNVHIKVCGQKLLSNRSC